MEVILLERVAKLGQMGETVRVKDGFARNFLLAKGKALRATKENKAAAAPTRTAWEPATRSPGRPAIVASESSAARRKKPKRPM